MLRACLNAGKRYPTPSSHSHALLFPSTNHTACITPSFQDKAQHAPLLTLLRFAPSFFCCCCCCCCCSSSKALSCGLARLESIFRAAYGVESKRCPVGAALIGVHSSSFLIAFKLVSSISTTATPLLDAMITSVKSCQRRHFSFSSPSLSRNDK